MRARNNARANVVSARPRAYRREQRSHRGCPFFANAVSHVLTSVQSHLRGNKDATRSRDSLPRTQATTARLAKGYRTTINFEVRIQGGSFSVAAFENRTRIGMSFRLPAVRSPSNRPRAGCPVRGPSSDDDSQAEADFKTLKGGHAFGNLARYGPKLAQLHGVALRTNPLPRTFRIIRSSFGPSTLRRSLPM